MRLLRFPFCTGRRSEYKNVTHEKRHERCFHIIFFPLNTLPSLVCSSRPSRYPLEIGFRVFALRPFLFHRNSFHKSRLYVIECVCVFFVFFFRRKREKNSINSSSGNNKIFGANNRNDFITSC